MARLSFTALLVLAISFYGIAGEEHYANVTVISILIREAKLATDAIRGITIRSPECKLQIASMATDFIVGLDTAKYSLNNVIPNIASGEDREELASHAKYFSTAANELEQSLLADTEQLKEKLVATMIQYAATLKQKHTDPNKHEVVSQFGKAQERRARNFILYSISKLKIQALLFNKTNKELGEEITASSALLTKTLSTLSTNDRATEEVLGQILAELIVRTARCISKLQNWVEVNPNKTDEIEAVEVFAKLLSEFYERLSRAVIGRNKTLYLKSELEDSYRISTKKLSKLTRLEYPENTGYQEFIRSSFLDGITIGRVYSETIKNFVSDA